MFTGLCARSVAELGLNRDVADVAARLLAAHESDGLRAHGGPDARFGAARYDAFAAPAAPPHVHAMAYVVAAINLLHGLAGGGDVDDADDAPGWRGRRTEARRAGRNATPATRRGRRSLPEKNGSLPANNGPAASERKLTIDPPRGGWVAWAERTMREGASAPRLPARIAEAATRTTADGDDDDDDGDDDGASTSHRESVDAFLEYCKSHALRGLEGGLPEAHRRTVDALWRIHDARGADGPSDGPLVPPRPTADLAPAPSPRTHRAFAAGRVATSRRRLGGPIHRRAPRRARLHRARARPAAKRRGAPAKLTSVQNAESYVAVVRACAGHAWADPQALHECARDVDAGFVASREGAKVTRGRGKGRRKGKGKGKGKGRRLGIGTTTRGLVSVVEGLERRFLRAAEVPEFPEPASRVKEDVPDVPNVPNVPDEETKTKRRRSSAAAIMPPPPPRLPAVATAPPTTARTRAKKKAAGSRSRGWILTRDASVVRVLETFFVSWMDSDEVWRRTRAECTSHP